MIYLDNAATTFPKAEKVYDEMDRVNRELAVNAGRGSYKAAREASELIGSTRSQLSNLLHADNIVFTPSVTHAINMILRGLNYSEESLVYMSPYEHNAVARTVHNLQEIYGFKIRLLPLKDDLTIDVEKSAYCFERESPDVVAVNMISNVTGYCLPYHEITEMAKQHNAFVLLDAAQAAGVLPIDMRSLKADAVCFAGHKSLGGPFGIGGFALRQGISLKTSFTGGTGSDSLNLSMSQRLPEGFEASSCNIVAMAGLHAALEEIDPTIHYNHLIDLTAYLKEVLQEFPNVRVMGLDQVGIVSIVVEGYASSDVGDILDNEYDIAVRTGYHCAPFIHDFLGDKPYGGTVRISFGMNNKKSDVDTVVDALRTL